MPDCYQPSNCARLSIIRIQYSGMSESYSSVQSKAAEAKDEYQQAEEALTAFIADSHIDDLNRLIAEKQHIIESLQLARQMAVTTVIDGKVEDGLQTLADHYTTKRKNDCWKTPGRCASRCRRGGRMAQQPTAWPS